MSVISFPKSPSTGDLYTFGEYTYRYDGEKWTTISPGNVAALRADLANGSDPAKGAALVGYNGTTVAETLQGVWNTFNLVVMPWTSVDGGTLTQPNQVFLHTANGNYYSWRGAYPSGGYVVSPGTDPTVVSGYVPRTDVLLRNELSSQSGASLIGLSQGGVLQDAITYVTPEMFMGVAANVTAAIQLAADNGLCIDMSGRNWKIDSSITFRDGTTVNIASSHIVANTGSAPLFIYNSTSGKGLTINGESGFVTGTASAFLSCTGTSTTPANRHYVKQIRLYGVHVTSTTIDKSLHFVNAVRQVFVDRCMFYTVNGVVATGKCVEVKFTKSIIYSSGGTNTVGIQLISPAGGNWYNEGWHFTDCTIDNFENTFDVRDVFVLTINGGYIGCNSATGYAFRFGGKTATHCREININTVIGGRIVFASSPSGWLVNSKISGILTRVSSDLCIAIENNANGIDFSGLKFEGVQDSVCALVKNNCSNIVFSDISTDQSPASGIHFTGQTGSGCAVNGLQYRGKGTAMYIERPVFKRGVTCATAQDAGYNQRTSPIASGTYAAGATISSVTMGIAKGDRGMVTFAVPYTGGTGTTAQTLQIVKPDEIVFPSASGHADAYTIIPAASGFASRTIPFYATSDVAGGVFELKNLAGNSLAIPHHGSMSVILN